MNFGLGALLSSYGISDLLTSTAVASDPESSEKQIPQQAAYQHDSSICTTNHTVARVKSEKTRLPSYIANFCLAIEGVA